ncbi:hypothetical protein DPEC_G00042640 [Dallia pectoralis]|uniref:Uncharacterized protein n=1 Tax=Dallia pectoralis TaxID=75939 RepID=A0ACC2H9I5_DALPE|nr:hypothetical protein DPEC_G00042640 [Dallia pectoralis]
MITWYTCTLYFSATSHPAYSAVCGLAHTGLAHCWMRAAAVRRVPWTSDGCMNGIRPHRSIARSDVSVTISTRRRMRLLTYTTLFWFMLKSGLALQIQCYQCEEVIHNECSTPEFIVNCTVNVQDMCQKEVLVKEDGVHYRKSCASSGACLIASSGYQQFCTGKLNSVCISCCNTPLCNGPSQKKPSSKNRVSSAASWHSPLHRLSFLFLPFILRTSLLSC